VFGINRFLVFQVKLTSISHIGTLFKVRFIQDSDLFRVRTVFKQKLRNMTLKMGKVTFCHEIEHLFLIRFSSDISGNNKANLEF
jgi:hypothetical protein